jgi:hypothetical protein
MLTSAADWIVSQLESAGELDMIRGLEKLWVHNGGLVAVYELLSTQSASEFWVGHLHVWW